MSLFTPATLQFLTQLRGDNNREWFEANRVRYERDVRGPALAFIETMALPMATISECFSAVARKVGGSLMRVHRDTRFSRDKTPYKTNVGIQFRHRAGRDAHAPGFYVHIEPGACFLGVGAWHPPGEALGKIRAFIDENPSDWRRARDDAAFRAVFEITGESLKNPPRGYATDHPLLEDLKRKDFIAMRHLADTDACAEDFAVRVAEDFRAAEPYMKCLCRALGVGY